jgi:hypothetical protein
MKERHLHHALVRKLVQEFRVNFGLNAFLEQRAQFVWHFQLVSVRCTVHDGPVIGDDRQIS